MADIETSRDGALLVVTINRAEKRNALNDACFDGLRQACDVAEKDKTVRAVVINGAGDKAFSSGIDLLMLHSFLVTKPNEAQIRERVHYYQDTFSRFERLAKPVVCAIDGVCLGGGLELALACDLRVGSSASTYGMPETKIGMLPDLGGTTRLTRLIGASRSTEWIFTGRQYPAVRALECGLLHELVVPNDALIRAKNLANEVAANGPLGLKWAKRVIQKTGDVALEASLKLEQDGMCEIIPSGHLEEGAAAFLQKRPAKFE